MKRYELEANACSAPYYPVEVLFGRFLCEDGRAIAVPSLAHPGFRNRWGETNAEYVPENDMNLVPKQLYIQWLSIREGQVYEGLFDLPQDTIISLLEAGYEIKYHTNRIEHGNYLTLMVGLAPGGFVAVWLQGVRQYVSIQQYEAEKIDAPNEEEYKKRTGEKFTDHITAMQEVYKEDAPDYITENPIPYGLWKGYESRYTWRPVVRLEDHAVKLEQIWIDHVNGERYIFFDSTANDAPYTQRSRPRSFYIQWRLNDDTYDAYIQIEYDTVRENFNELSNSNIEMTFNINKYNNHIDIELRTKEKACTINEDNCKIKIFKNEYKIYANYPENGTNVWDKGYDQ